MTELTLAEQITAVRESALDLHERINRTPVDYVDPRAINRQKALRAALATLEASQAREVTLQRVVEASRRALNSMALMRMELTDPGAEALAAEYELKIVLDALPPPPAQSKGDKQ